MKVRVLPEAFEDLSKAVDWYNSRREGLGQEFEEVFYSSVNHIHRHPLIHGFVYREFRRHLFQQFPYRRYYRIHEDEIIVSLVFHLARSPKTMRRILRSRKRYAK